MISHPSRQQVACLESETGGTGEPKLVHATGGARQFYSALSQPALIGMEATGTASGSWNWPGAWDTRFGSAIRASHVRKQKLQRFLLVKCDYGHFAGNVGVCIIWF